MSAPPRPSKAELAAATARGLPDLIAPQLKLWFCGINPGLYSAAIGCHFGRPGNRFWPTLEAAGFTPRRFDPSEQAQLLALGYGITNLVPRTTAKASELDAAELRAGYEALREKLQTQPPRLLALLGISAYREAFAQPKAQLGLQADTLCGVPIWVLPSPSGLNAHYQRTELAALFRDCRLYLETLAPPSYWALWREDDNGNRFLVQAGLTQAEAQALLVDFQSRGHKQCYWLESE